MDDEAPIATQPRGRRRRRIAFALGALGVIVLFASSGDWFTRGAVDAALRDAAAPAAAATAHTRSRPNAAAAVPGAGGDAALADARVPGPGEAEVCGLGIVKVDQRDPYGARQIPDAIKRETEHRLQAVMQASPDERVRAAAGFLEARSLARQASEAVAAATPPCAASDAACNREARRLERGAGALAAVPAVDALAQRAATSADPLVYAFAVEACARDESVARGARWCELISAEQWTRLDPHNATAWLKVAVGARRRRDGAAEAEAMYRASTATDSDAHRALLARLVGDMLPADAPEAGRSVVVFEASNLPGLVAWEGLDAANRHCAAEVLADANRRQTCEALANVMLDHGTTVREAAIGRRIGERLGWPAERVQALRDEQRQLAEAPARWLSEAGVLSCEGVRRRMQWAELVEVLGELGAARELLSGGQVAPAAVAASAAGAGAPAFSSEGRPNPR